MGQPGGDTEPPPPGSAQPRRNGRTPLGSGVWPLAPQGSVTAAKCQIEGRPSAEPRKENVKLRLG